MALLDSINSAVSTANSATTAISNVAGTAKSLISAGPASALSGISSGLSDIFGSITKFFKPAPGGKLPQPNPLFAYASYDYIIGIGILTDDDLNFPDKSYRGNKRIPLICKSANADPGNRIQTPYGKFDFFIDNVVLNQVIGHEKGNNTNVTTLAFEITEPYSMGMFMIALQTAAYKAGHMNWHAAPYLLTLQFRGNKETGQMSLIKDTDRQIPFKFSTISTKVTQAGAVHTCAGFSWNGAALSDRESKLKSDVSVSGKTVQELLQTGEKSLQVVINQRLQQLKTDGVVAIADEILIMFPDEIASASTASSGAAPEDTTGATTTTTAAEVGLEIFSKLGVTRSTRNKTLVQPDGKCNALGAASMNFSVDRKGDIPVGKDNKVYDSAKQRFIRGQNTIDFTQSDFRFRQDTDIPNAINQVLIQSSFADSAFDASNLTKEGYRGWWRIDTQVYNISTNANDTKTGVKPKLIVYRVIPYAVHASAITAPNVRAPGFAELKKQAVKVYDYIYTGKNVDVISFDISLAASYMQVLAADNFKRSQDVKTAEEQGGSTENNANIQPVTQGNAPSLVAGANPTAVNYSGTSQKTDKQGGGGPETEGSRAARLFHDVVNAGTDQQILNMNIIGDPYFIAQSGQGNYTASPTQYTNLNSDGSVNYQNGEVDVVVNFRTPIDINQTTGLYNFGGQSKSAPVIGFSGLYKINTVTSTFKGGKFTQMLEGFRRKGQDFPTEGTPEQTFTPNNPSPVPATNGGWGEGQ